MCVAIAVRFLWVVVWLASVAVAAEKPDPAAGFIHGTVTDKNGASVTGFVRWEDEEAFWDDLFHSRQIAVPWTEFVDMKALHKEKQRHYFETHGLFDRLAYALENKNPDAEISRLFIMRFGDIAAIRIDREDNIDVALNDGSTHTVRGYSNDVSSDLIVYPAAGEKVIRKWDEIAEIRFSAAPPGAVPYADRLYGQVSTSRGDFEGFIQWDKSECTSIDVLDSDQQDVPMGDIKSIARVPGQGTEVALTDGRTLILSGSNDVDGGNRGVVVETADRGRVTIPWQRFRKVVFRPAGSGAGREAYAGNGELTGAVTRADGAQFSGRLVFDLDEARRHDIFNGVADDLEYDIPFFMIRTISPLSGARCRITLRNGQQLELGDAQDTGRDHGGVLVFAADQSTARRVPWREIREMQLAR